MDLVSMVLNAEQSREYKRASDLQLLLNDNVKIYSGYAPFNDEAQSFFSNFSNVQSYLAVKELGIAPVTEGKSNLKTSIAQDAGIICTAVSVYARMLGDLQLAYAVRYRTSDINRVKDGTVLTIINGISNAVMPLIGNPDFDSYNITADMLNNLVADATTYNSSISKSNMMDIKRSVANKGLNQVFAAIRGNVSNMNLLINQFKRKNPDFVDEYHKAVALDYSNIRHNGVGGKITNSVTDNVIKGVTIAVEGENKKATSAADGTYKIDKVKTGNRTLIVTAPGYASQTIPVKIIRSTTIEVNIAWVAQVITMATA